MTVWVPIFLTVSLIRFGSLTSVSSEVLFSNEHDYLIGGGSGDEFVGQLSLVRGSVNLHSEGQHHI